MAQETGIKQMMVKIIKECAPAPTIEEGIISKMDPLSITLVNDKKMNLTEDDLIVPARLEKAGALEKGDRVNLLVYNMGKSYYVLDKA